MAAGGGNALARSAAYWDDYSATHLAAGGSVNRAEWLAHPVVQDRDAARRGGRSLSEWFAHDVLGGRTVERGLGVGAGGASFELDLLASGVVERFDLYEISAASTIAGRRRAAELGVADRVDFHDIDMNVMAPEPRAYDLLTFISSLHHVEALESVLRQSRNALRSAGLLFASEYIGPNRFRFPVAHTQAGRSLYRQLDPSLTCGLPELPLPDPAEVERADPSEAVRSQDILSVLHEVFDDVEVYARDGCLPFTMWWGLDHDALYETSRGMQLVELICDLDDSLTAAGLVPTYFADLVARATS